MPIRLTATSLRDDRILADEALVALAKRADYVALHGHSITEVTTA
jgi:hypothetical protein